MVSRREAVQGLLATIGFLVLPGIVFWWVLGEEPPSCAECVDRALQPPDLPDGLVTAGIVIAVIGLLCLLAAVIRLTSTQRLRSRWWRVWLPLAGVSLLGALVVRAGTAPVGGANIGFGLLMLFSIVVVPVLYCFATWHLVRLLAPGWNGWFRALAAIAGAVVGPAVCLIVLDLLTGF